MDSFRRLLCGSSLAVAVTTATSGAGYAAEAGAFLTQVQARNLAIEILRGNPYGTTDDEIAKIILRGALIVTGTSECSVVEIPVWSFAIKTSGEPPIEGMLDIDATSGTLTCASLPFLS